MLVNPPTLHRGRSITDLRHVSPDQPGVPYYWRLLAVDASRHESRSSFTGEHLGLQSIQASLQKAGQRVVVLNACILMHTSLEQTLSCLQAYQFELVGFSGPLDVFAENLWLARNLRRFGYTGHITLGHDFATLNHIQILDAFPEFDSVVRGEGEITLCELSAAIERNQPLDHICGLTYRSEQGVVVNPPRPPCDLRKLPWVTRYDLPAVLKIGMSAGIFTKRGCPYQCAFCTTGQVPLAEGYTSIEQWRVREPRDIVNEIQYLVEDFGINNLTIVDDLYIAKGLNGSMHAVEVAEEILQRHLCVQYMIDCRVDSISRDGFALLKRSGLKKVFVGVESGSSVALDLLNKGYKPQAIGRQLQILDDLGIEVVLGFLFFNPADSIHDLEQSYKLLLDLGVRDFTLFLQGVRVYPGTVLQYDLAKKGLLVGEFPYFSSRYRDPFVGQLFTVLSEFKALAVPLLSLRDSDEIERVRIERGVFELVRDCLGEMIVCCKHGDIDTLDALHVAMRTSFFNLVARD